MPKILDVDKILSLVASGGVIGAAAFNVLSQSGSHGSPMMAASQIAISELGALAGSVLHGQFGKLIDKWRPGHDTLFNHDLTKAIGASMAARLRHEAMEIQGPDRETLMRMADCAIDQWMKIAARGHKRLADLRERNLPALIAHRAEGIEPHVMDEASWKLVYEEFHQFIGAPEWQDGEILTRLSHRMPALFAGDLTEILKEDYAKPDGGRAYAGLELLLQGEILATSRFLREAVERNKQEVLAAVRESEDRLMAHLQQARSLENDALKRLAKLSVSPRIAGDSEHDEHRETLVWIMRLDESLKTRIETFQPQLKKIFEEYSSHWTQRQEGFTRQILEEGRSEAQITRDEARRHSEELRGDFSTVTQKAFAHKWAILVGAAALVIVAIFVFRGESAQARGFAELQKQTKETQDQLAKLFPPITSPDDANLPLSLATKQEYERLIAQLQGQEREARDKFQKELRIGVDARLGKATGQLRQGRYHDAATTYESVLQSEPGNEMAMFALAFANMNEGRFSDAETVLMKAKKLSDRGQVKPEFEIGILVALGNLRIHQGRVDQAENFLETALKRAHDLLGPENVYTSAVLSNLGIIYNRQDRDEEAEQILLRAIQLDDEGNGKEGSLARDMNNLAALYIKQSRNSEAESLLDSAIDIQETLMGPSHPEVASSLSNLGRVYLAQGRFDDAEAIFLRALTIKETNFGDDHPLTAQALVELGGFYDDSGFPVQAEGYLKAALAIFEKHAANQRYLLASTLNSLGLIYARQLRYEDAESQFAKAEAAAGKLSGVSKELLATVWKNKADLYRDWGRMEPAEALYKQALGLDENLFGPDSPAVASDLSGYAKLCSRVGRSEEAEGHLRRAIDILTQAYGDESIDLAAELQGLGYVLAELHRYEESEASFRRAITIVAMKVGSHNPEYAYRLNDLGWNYMQAGRFVEADAYFARALAVDEKAFPPGHVALALDHENLASARIEQERWQDAEDGLGKGLQIVDEMPEGVYEKTTLLVSMAHLSIRRKQFEQALPFIARAEEGMKNAPSPGSPMELELLMFKAAALANTGNPEGAKAAMKTVTDWIAKEKTRYTRALTSRASYLEAEWALEAKALPEADKAATEALALREAYYPEPHPRIAESLELCAAIKTAMGEEAEATALLHRAEEMHQVYQRREEERRTQGVAIEGEGVEPRSEKSWASDDDLPDPAASATQRQSTPSAIDLIAPFLTPGPTPDPDATPAPLIPLDILELLSQVQSPTENQTQNDSGAAAQPESGVVQPFDQWLESFIGALNPADSGMNDDQGDTSEDSEEVGSDAEDGGSDAGSNENPSSDDSEELSASRGAPPRGIGATRPSESPVSPLDRGF